MQVQLPEFERWRFEWLISSLIWYILKLYPQWWSRFPDKGKGENFFISPSLLEKTNSEAFTDWKSVWPYPVWNSKDMMSPKIGSSIYISRKKIENSYYLNCPFKCCSHVQIKSSNSLAQLYSTSTMEHHHFDQCLMILNTKGNQILVNLSQVVLPSLAKPFFH